jgi:hypothetical protein
LGAKDHAGGSASARDFPQATLSLQRLILHLIDGLVACETAIQGRIEPLQQPEKRLTVPTHQYDPHCVGIGCDSRALHDIDTADIDRACARTVRDTIAACGALQIRTGLHIRRSVLTT